MQSITINITRASVLADMKVKSHAEVAAIADPKERYLAELGGEKEQEANQCINDAVAEVESILRPLLVFGNGDPTSWTDTYDTTATITFTLSLTARKSPGMATALGKAVHAYIVDSALDKFYTSVSHVEMANTHKSKLPGELAVINKLIYTRFNPSYS